MGLRRAFFGPTEKEKQEKMDTVRNRVANGEGCAWCGGKITGLIHFCIDCRETSPFCSDRCVYEHEVARHRRGVDSRNSSMRSAH
jgi:hypothetical protein